MIGRTLGHFHILEKIGAGGMGEVYRARDQHLERDVAIKVLPAGRLPDEAARRQFRQEALTLSKLNHPNIATVHDFVTEPEADFLVMEYVAGYTLAEKLGSGPLAEKEILAMGAQLAEGLAAAHEHGVIHRDLKPGNLRVTPDGRLKILDFGLARFLGPAGDSAPTQTQAEIQEAAGTLPYMAPEQLSGEPTDARSDLYSAGAVLYEMATGQRLFPNEREAQRQLAAILHQQPRRPQTLNPHISAGLESVILKALEKDPEHRYQSAREILADLRRLGVNTAMIEGIAIGKARRSKTTPLAAGAILVLAVCLGAGWWLKRSRATAAHEIHAIAVLPLANLSADSSEEFFSDGMTEALITNLSKTRAVRVISLASVMQYKGGRKPVHEIGRELNVDAVVTGSVTRSENHVRISVELADAQTDRNFWADSYEGRLGEVIDLQNEAARAIAGEIRAQLPASALEPNAKTVVNPQAYEAYLRGRYYWNRRTPEDVKKGMAYFQNAMQLDPAYALAYSGLAESYILLQDLGELPAREAMPLAKAAAQKALDLDATLAGPHTSLAAIHWTYDWDMDAAGREFERALALDPNDATAHEWYGLYLSQNGRRGQAIGEMQRAHELDPLSLIIEVNVGRCQYYAREYDEAVRVLEGLREREPDAWVVHMILGQTYLVMGRLPEAIRELERSNVLLPDYARNLGVLGDAYGRAGRRNEAEQLARKLAQASQSRYISPVYTALIRMGMGNKSLAIAFLEKAYEERSDWMPQLNVEPEFDLLRSDARFQDLLRRIAHQPKAAETQP